MLAASQMYEVDQLTAVMSPNVTGERLHCYGGTWRSRVRVVKIELVGPLIVWCVLKQSTYFVGARGVETATRFDCEASMRSAWMLSSAWCNRLLCESISVWKLMVLEID